MSHQTSFTKDVANKQVKISRVFDATLDAVWQAYTDSKLLDQWWGPQPWRAETKTMDFSVGGHWLYAMVGPNGERQWNRFDYTAIDKLKSIEAMDAFCDENGIRNPDLPSAPWRIVFTASGNGTNVEMVLSFTTEADMKKLLETGFEEGMRIDLEQLAAVLEKK
jgi:uncharacterized protein YndB with AHSA1/START domain